MHVEKVALSSYSRFLKATILVGIPFFFLMGAMGVWLAIDDAPSNAAVVIFVGMAVGLINGILIARFHVQPFIITLAALLAARGGALNLSNNASVSIDFTSNYRDLWTTKVGDVPLPVLITIILYAVGSMCP